jgi:hypothetical protein
MITPPRSEAAILRDRTNESTRWSYMLRAAREDRAWRVERDCLSQPLAHRAQDYGLVPHPVIEAIGHSCCDRQVRTLATAASIIRFGYRHPWSSLSRIHLTAWETASIAIHRQSKGQ